MMHCWNCGQIAVHRRYVANNYARCFSCADCKDIDHDLAVVSVVVQPQVALERADRQKELLEDQRDSGESTPLFASGDSAIAVLKKKCEERKLSVVITPLRTDGISCNYIGSF